MSDLKTPIQWAMALGQFTVGPKPRREKQPSWQHNVAAVVHGWAQHEHDAQKPIELTKDAYLGAIRAVEKQLGDGTLRPHGPALSPHCKLQQSKPAPVTRSRKSEPQQEQPSRPKTIKKKIRRRKSAPKG